MRTTERIRRIDPELLE
jgi:hypothetical protein